jgi:hypothetical protein
MMRAWPHVPRWPPILAFFDQSVVRFDFRGTVPPNSPEAEISVLGAILIDNARIGQVSDWLKTEHFYQERNRIIYSAMVKLNLREDPIDPVTLGHALNSLRLFYDRLYLSVADRTFER